MSNDKNDKQSKTEQQLAEYNAAAGKDNKQQGRGATVGEATPALTLKQRWHSECFMSQGAGSKNTKKFKWVRIALAPSLKQYARKLVAQKDETALAWFGNKNGINNAVRSDKNKARIATEKQATKASKKGKQSKS